LKARLEGRVLGQFASFDLFSVFRIFDHHGCFVAVGQSKAISGVDGGAIENEP